MKQRLITGFTGMLAEGMTPLDAALLPGRNSEKSVL